jgi:hypothetical protein
MACSREIFTFTLPFSAVLRRKFAQFVTEFQSKYDTTSMPGEVSSVVSYTRLNEVTASSTDSYNQATWTASYDIFLPQRQLSCFISRHPKSCQHTQTHLQL